MTWISSKKPEDYTIKKRFSEDEKIEIFINSDFLEYGEDSDRVDGRNEGWKNETFGWLQFVIRAWPPGNWIVGRYFHRADQLHFHQK